MRRYIALLSLFLISISISAQYSEIFKRDILLSEKVVGYYEGYKISSGMNDFTYHSFREDISEAMLSRCTDGNMSIEWETEKVTGDINSACGFIWMAAMDLTDEKCRFEVYIDEIKRFEIYSGPDPVLNVESTGEGNMNFYPVETDTHGDIHGYMTLEAPAEWIFPGRPLKISIKGSEAGSNTWIIVYKANDALSYLQNKARYSFHLKARLLNNNNNYDVILHSPECFSGKELEIISGKNKMKKALTSKNNRSELGFKMNLSGEDDNLIIKDEFGELLNIKDINAPGSTTRIQGKLVIINKLEANKNGISIDIQRLYKPKTGTSLLRLSRSKMNIGNIYLMNSSHQDIAWMDTPGKCVIDRDTMLLEPLIGNAIISDSYRFDIEDALMLKEYIDRHPGKKKIVGELLKSGRLSCGSSFIQPYEEMYSGESLARQLYFGARWLKKEFDYDAVVYWNVDVPGRTLQMPQILKKGGTDYMIFSRFGKGFYKWYSPDGSYITAYSPGHYANSYGPLQRNFFEAARYISENALSWSEYFNKGTEVAIPLLSDWDMSPANDYGPLADKWMNLSEIENEDGVFEKLNLPEFRITTANVFFKALSKQADNISHLKGERPAVWLYIHGPSHYQALKASREADILLTKVEKFNSALAAVKSTFEYYPVDELNAAWEAKIYPDHGWGGKGGDITDSFFNMKFNFARSEARRLLEKVLFTLSSEIDVREKNGNPLVVFNSMSSVRTDIAKVELVFPEESGNTLVLRDEKGSIIPSQLSEIRRNSDGSLHTAILVFLASDVPSVGYKTYYYELVNNRRSDKRRVDQNNHLSNDYFDITLGPRGIEYLYDKEYNEVIIDNDTFAGGEVITMKSVGNGAGEFKDIQQPEMDDYDFTGSCGENINWQMIEDGELYTRMKIRQPVKYAEIERIITVYHVYKKIDIDISILNWQGILYREFRMVMPLKQTDADIAYEVPFGVLRVGKDEIAGAAGERYTTECNNIHPRGIQNWISSSNKKVGFTMSSDVVVADYTDPLNKESGKPVLQAVLLASRRSCHWQGNQYLQTGDHHYHFSFTSHKPGWENGCMFGTGSNEKLDVIKPVLKSSTASLPENMSFFSTGNKNIIISTVKKAEDNNALVTRVYEYKGGDTDLKFKLFRDIQTVYKTNLIEYPQSKIRTRTKNGFTVKVGKYSIETFRFDL
ncbi:MAG TPA: alpha-mannosidase [Bacteroidales bacterium]|nr:alpha-mannosidase [Bacteroidales bacterium]